MADDNKVTITLGSAIDNGSTQTIEGPLLINGVVNSFSDLYSYSTLTSDPLNFTSDDSVVYFVRNINNDSTTDKTTANTSSGLNYPERGAFYRYNWDTKDWDLIMVGSHSHADMELLDRLGEIDITALPTGAEKVLMLKKTDSTSTADLTSEYDLTWVDQKTLPDIIKNGKEQYLAADATGNIAWSNELLPVQTSRSLKVTVSADNLKSNKQLVLTGEYLSENSASYDSKYDDVLVIDDGLAVSDAEISTEEDTDSSNALGYDVYITIPDTDNHVFEAGETVLVMILRNGLAGTFDTIKDQYATKSDLVKYASSGTFDLSGYVTEDELKTVLAKYSKVGHTHADYIKRTDYDAFDWRYAPYYHNHSQYITITRFLDLLGQITDTSSDVQQIFDNYKTEVDDAIANLVNDKNDILQAVQELLSSATFDADKIIYDDDTLSNYLLELKSQLDSTANPTDKDVTTVAPITVQLGNDSSIGYSSGDVILAGTRLNTILTKMLRKKIAPSLVSPTVSAAEKQSTQITGSDCVVTIVPDFIQNDGGTLSSITINVYIDKDGKTLFKSYAGAEGSATSITLPLIAKDTSGFCYRIDIVAAYGAGPEKKDNLGNGGYKIAAGSAVATYTITCKPAFMIGYLKSTIDSADAMNYSLLHAALENSGENFDYYTEDDLDSYMIRKKIISDSAARSLLLLRPVSSSLSFDEVQLNSQGYDLLDDMEEKIVDMNPDQNGPFDNYEVHYMTLNQALRSNIVLTAYLKKVGD